VAAQLLHAVLERRNDALGGRPHGCHERLLRGGELGGRGGRAEARGRHGHVGIVVAIAAKDAGRVVELVVLVVIVVPAAARVHLKPKNLVASRAATLLN